MLVGLYFLSGPEDACKETLFGSRAIDPISKRTKS